MLISLDRIMGCGRSKCDSQNSTDEVKDRKLIKQKNVGGGGKSEKNNKISDWRENEDPVKTTNTKVASVQREKPSRKQEEKVTLKTASANVNGNIVSKSENEEKKTCEKLNIPAAKESKAVTATKDKTPSLQNQTGGITSSQVEFFRLLDEKIESGRDYFSHSESDD